MSDHHEHGKDCACGCNQPLLSSEALELLEKHHDFPGPYMFKAIGFASDDFTGRAVAAVEGVLGTLEEGRTRARASSGDKYLSVTMEVEVADSRQVLEVYHALKALEGLVAVI